MDVFSRYAPFIQDYIYNHGWQNLRAIQVAAAEELFNTDHNVLLSSATASGKPRPPFFSDSNWLAGAPRKLNSVFIHCAA